MHCHSLNQLPAGKPFGNVHLIREKNKRLQMSVHKSLKACHKTEKQADYLNRSVAGKMSVKAKTLK